MAPAPYELVAELALLPLQGGQRTLFPPPSSPRHCRFCLRDAPVVRFKKDAHLFPEFLGNHYFLSSEECDACNEAGSVLEDDLAKHLTITRTLSRVGGKSPSVKHRFGKQPSSVIGDSRTNLITVEKYVEDDSVRSSRIAGGIRYAIRVPSYQPINAAKALARIGLFLAPAELLAELDHVRKWIRGEESWAPLFYEAFVPGPGLATIRAALERRNNADVGLPAYLIHVVYSTCILILPLPGSDWSPVSYEPPADMRSPYPPHDVRWTRFSKIAPGSVRTRVDTVDIAVPALRDVPPPSHEAIAVRAYFKWLDGGRRGGGDLKDWLDAEQELLWEQVPKGAAPGESAD